MVVSVRSSSDQISLAVSVVSVAGLQGHTAAIRERVHSVELDVLLLSAAVGGDTHRVGVVVSDVEGGVSAGLALANARVRVQESETERTDGSNREPEVSFLLCVTTQRQNLRYVSAVWR